MRGDEPHGFDRLLALRRQLERPLGRRLVERRRHLCTCLDWSSVRFIPSLPACAYGRLVERRRLVAGATGARGRRRVRLDGGIVVVDAGRLLESDARTHDVATRATSQLLIVSFLRPTVVVTDTAVQRSAAVP